MEQTVIRIKICPKCGLPYKGYPALSRVEGIGDICPDCGTREALESLGIDPKEQDIIISTIHKYEGESTDETSR